MAGNGKRGGGDRVLESRHLVGLFLGVVLLCGVFFTLGYVMGRTQYGGAVHAADALQRQCALRTGLRRKIKSCATAKTAPAPPDHGEWDFYAKKKTQATISSHRLHLRLPRQPRRQSKCAASDSRGSHQIDKSAARRSHQDGRCTRTRAPSNRHDSSRPR